MTAQKTLTVHDLTPDAIMAAITEFYDLASGHVTRIAKRVGNETTVIPQFPRKLGTYQFPYFFAADIDQLSRFAMGGLQAANKFVLDLCATVESVLFTAPVGGRVPVPEDWHAKGIGGIVFVAQARCALRREEGPSLTHAQVRAVTGATDEDLKSGGLLAKRGDAPAAVRDYCEKNELPV